MSLSPKEWRQAVSAIANACIGTAPGFGPIVRIESVLTALKPHADKGVFFEVNNSGQIVFGFNPEEPDKP